MSTLSRALSKPGTISSRGQGSPKGPLCSVPGPLPPAAARRQGLVGVRGSGRGARYGPVWQ
ncbi:hypothetical protein DFQ26_007225, partial [Actinomortierella ambigua]